MKKAFLKRLGIGILLGLCSALLVLFINYVIISELLKSGDLLNRLDLKLYDLFYGARFSLGKFESDPTRSSWKIGIIVIDDNTLADPYFGRWPFPRSRYAGLIEKLENAGVKTILLDILFQEKSFPQEDLAFQKVLAQSRKVILCGNFYSDQGKIQFRSPLSELTAAWTEQDKAKLIGYTYEDADPDGVVRRIPLRLNLANRRYNSVDLLAFSHFTGLPPEGVEFNPGNGYLKLGELKVPTDPYGKNLINYFANPEKPGAGLQGKMEYIFSIYSLSDVFKMSPEELKDYFAGKLVLLGVTAAAGVDIKQTPIGRMSGVLIHANFLLSLLQNSFIYQVSWQSYLWLMLFAGLLGGVLFSLLSPRSGIVLTALLGAGFIALAVYLFIGRGLMLRLSGPELTLVLTFLGVTVYRHRIEEKAREKFRQMVEEFAPLPQAYIESYVHAKGDKAFREKVNLSVLFSDIRGYTTLSETMDPMEIADMLNEYHQAMGEVFDRNKGVVFTYIGDAQMVVFGLPEITGKAENHAYWAVKAGLEMQERLAELNRKWEKEGKKTFAIGVGIATGEVSLGVVGGAQRRQFTVLGDTVNMAARLEGLSKVLNNPVNISQGTYEACKDRTTCQAAEPIQIKGKAELQQVYLVKDLK